MSFCLGIHTKVEEEGSLCFERTSEEVCTLSCPSYPTPILDLLDLNYAIRGSMIPFPFPKGPSPVYLIYFIRSKPFLCRWEEMSMFYWLMSSTGFQGVSLALIKCAWYGLVDDGFPWDLEESGGSKLTKGKEKVVCLGSSTPSLLSSSKDPK